MLQVIVKPVLQGATALLAPLQVGPACLDITVQTPLLHIAFIHALLEPSPQLLEPSLSPPAAHA